MSGAPVLRALPGGTADQDADQVARRQQSEKERPDAVNAFTAPDWAGSLVACCKRAQVTALALGQLASLVAGAEAVARDFPKWRVRLSSAGRWEAAWQGPHAIRTLDGEISLTVGADDLAGLRAELTAVDRALACANAR